MANIYTDSEIIEILLSHNLDTDGICTVCGWDCVGIPESQILEIQDRMIPTCQQYILSKLMQKWEFGL